MHILAKNGEICSLDDYCKSDTRQAMECMECFQVCEPAVARLCGSARARFHYSCESETPAITGDSRSANVFTPEMLHFQLDVLWDITCIFHREINIGKIASVV